MTAIYSYSEAEVKIRKNKQLFIITPESKNKSPLDVEGVNVDITIQKIISFIHESRKL